MACHSYLHIISFDFHVPLKKGMFLLVSGVTAPNASPQLRLWSGSKEWKYWFWAKELFPWKYNKYHTVDPTKVNVSQVSLMRLQILIYITMKEASNFLVKMVHFTMNFLKPKLIDIWYSFNWSFASKTNILVIAVYRPGLDRKKCHLELEKFLLVLEYTLGIEVLGKWG